MEINKIPGIVLLFVVVGMLIGVGILALDKFGVASRELTTVTNESFTMPAVGANVSLSNQNIVTFSRILNASDDIMPTANYTVYATEGKILNVDNATGFEAGETVYAYYTYWEYDTATEDATTATSSAIADISTTWLSLIITIVVLALILALVITSFGTMGR